MPFKFPFYHPCDDNYAGDGGGGSHVATTPKDRELARLQVENEEQYELLVSLLKTLEPYKGTFSEEVCAHLVLAKMIVERHAKEREASAALQEASTEQKH